MDETTIRKGRPGDAEDFAELAIVTAPEYFEVIFGKGAKYMLKRLFTHPDNIFSFRHSYFLEVNGEVAGMTLFYDYNDKTRGVVPFVLMLIRYLKFGFLAHLPALLKFGAIFARINKDDLYSSNSAIYPKFRGRGLGEKLFGLSEETARKKGLRRVVVDVKADNVKAIQLRKKLGYNIEIRLPAVNIKGKVFEYLQLVKYI